MEDMITRRKIKKKEHTFSLFSNNNLTIAKCLPFLFFIKYSIFTSAVGVDKVEVFHSSKWNRSSIFTYFSKILLESPLEREP